jgi:exodeoxyribonuclease-5
MSDDRSNPTFRQRAGSFKSQRSDITLPKAQTPDEIERVEEALFGGWVRDTKHQYRYLTPAERTDRVIENPVREQDLSPDQYEVFQSLCSWYAGRMGDRDLCTMGGYAGTGKSTVVSVFARRHHHARIAYCAYTGKAANVLKQKLRSAGVSHPAYVGTIHRLMYKGRTNYREEIVGWEKVESLDFNLIVVDEGSMVSKEIFDDLRSFGIPILVVGDHGQLAPIEGQFNLMESPQLRLEKVHRQAEGSPIISLATYIREEGMLPFQYENNEFVSFVKPALMREELHALYMKALLSNEDLSNIAVLCYTNAKRRMANNMIRQIRWGAPEEAPPRDGDMLICLRNCLGILFNGMRARAISVKDNGRLWYWINAVFDEDDIEIKASMFKPQFNRDRTISRYEDIQNLGFYEQGWSKELGLLFDFGYCLTTHKAQGSAFKNVFLLYEKPGQVSNDDFRRWLYTSVTRSSERLAIVTK